MLSFNYPLLLRPIAVPRPWGGGRLPALYGRENVEAAEPIGESWEVSTWPHDPGNPNLPTVTEIMNGPLAGTPLDQLVHVPVVIKLLDSSEKLSVQVHPVSDDVHKDEMWYILFAEPDAYLYYGLNDNVTGEHLCKLIRSDKSTEEEVLSCLKTVNNLQPGQFFNVPSGTVHAIGPGIVAFEVSESMQVTYRLYDYNRGRELHVDQACEALSGSRNVRENLDAVIDIEGHELSDLITSFPSFSVTRIIGDSLHVKRCSKMHILTPTNGDCAISGSNNDWNVIVRNASSCLVPATLEGYHINMLEGKEVLLTALDS